MRNRFKECEAFLLGEAFKINLQGDSIKKLPYYARKGEFTYCIVENCKYGNQFKPIKLEDNLIGYVCKANGRVPIETKK